MVSPESGSNEPLLIDAGAAQAPGVSDTVTFVQSATGAVFGGAAGGVGGGGGSPHTTLAVLLRCFC